ncbi:MAG: dephospho-CoA kinase [Phycisphaerae bacterium]|nr:dephospho-CoA kinase [Phycisphaerae bacterium]
MTAAYPKPIIGLTGAIGSGKTCMAREFGRLGCLVIDSDDLAHQALNQPTVKTQLGQWWGAAIFDSSTGQVDRSAVGRLVFADAAEMARLTALLYPQVAAMREKIMASAALDSKILAIVWDSPLLIENGLHTQCDAIIFVKASMQTRISRLKEDRGWDAQELLRREKMQLPLDKKEKLAHYYIDNDGDVAVGWRQVQSILARVIQNYSAKNDVK